MRSAFAPGIAGLTLALLIPGSVALALTIENQRPETYDEVETLLTDTIPGALEQMQCGGWKDDTVNGKIATVTGAPGRRHKWDGAILSGMGTRIDENGDGNKDNDYQYPDLAQGLATTCSAETDRVERTVWEYTNNADRPYEVVQVTYTFPHPYYTDPGCRWRFKNDDDELVARAPGNPLQPFETYETPPDKDRYKELDEEPNNRLSPPNCEEFCSFVNDYQYVDCEETETVATLEFPFFYTICPEGKMKQRYLCSMEMVPDNPSPDICKPSSTPAEWPNARSCKADGCRCPGPNCPTAPQGQEYQSYYRYYPVTYSRQNLTDIDGMRDQSSNTAQVACYGFYNEFDPYHHQTLAQDRRCVINTSVNGFFESQKGKGEYGQNSGLPDRDPNVDANQRNRGSYDAATDLWYLKLSGGFSLLNEKVFSGSYKRDLTNVFLATEELDSARMQATQQLDANRPLAKSNQIRAFDETGTGRILVSWWQKQQNDMANILHPGVVRMVLPSGWAFGVDPDDPFLSQLERPLPEHIDTRGQRIELQISAEEDILGSAIAYIERSLLLRVHEEPVPLLLPVGSASEFRAKSEAWCLWYIREFNERTCDNAPADIKALMEKLELYADTIDDVRVLRGELARYAGDVLELQYQVTKPISEWMEKNIDAYKEVLAEQEELRDRLLPKWNDVVEEYDTFTAQTNLPWCMNQRFTNPIYSMLDQWLPSRGLGGAKITADLLPKLHASPAEDIVIDFSTIAYMSGSIALPVLKPMQVRITGVPLPPDGPEYDPPPPLPDLPSVDRITEYIRDAADSLPQPPDDTKTPPAITAETMGEDGIRSLEGTLDAMLQLVKDMDERYKKFWKSIGPWKDGDPDPDFDPGNTRGIAYKKSKLECESWDDSTCQHVEMDLVERFTRIGSRPLVFLNEDYESAGYERGIGGPCVAENHVCTPMHPEGFVPRIQWEIIGPRTQADESSDVRRKIRNVTLPEPVGGVQSSSFPRYDTELKYLLPTYDVPRAIDLTPPASSSASSR